MEGADEKGVTLLLVDVQKDFHPGGSLAIPTADEDAERIARLIRTHPHKINKIIATLDSHHKLHIAHPRFWTSPETNKNPSPFTIISHQDLLDGKWKPTVTTKKGLPPGIDTVVLSTTSTTSSSPPRSIEEYVLEYTRRLEEKGRFQLCVWPEHCLLATDGHSMVDAVRSAIDDWSVLTGRSPRFLQKGTNNWTEMYSAIQAEVPVNHETSLNTQLLHELMDDDNILLVCGQAMSHCVNYTLRDIVQHWKDPSALQHVCLLTDCASPVPTFETAATQLQQDMKEAGVTLTTSDRVFGE